MAKALFYRRSFHSDRDLLGIPPLELDQVIGGPQLLPGRKGLEGLEAPRNSLDIQPSIIQAENRLPRADDIPMGYELTRSLTTPKKRDDQCQPKFMQFSEITKVEPEQKRRSTNVIARLMGLDFMPVSNGARSSKGTSAEKRPHHPKKQERLLSVHSLTDLPIQEWHAEFENERQPREALSFREHPQEQQLQEFKREFACRLAAQAENLPLKEAEFRQTSKPVRGHEMQAHFRPTNNPRSCAVSGESAPAALGTQIAALANPANTSNSREFMEALQFLQANKKLFLEVLHNRKPLLSARLQEAVRGKTLGRTKSTSRALDTSSIKERLELGSTSTSRAGKSRMSMQEQSATNPRSKISEGGSSSPSANKPSTSSSNSSGGWRQSTQKKFEPNETMPSQRRGHSKRIGNAQENSCGGGGKRKVAERIVVLKPTLKKEVASKNHNEGGMICTLHASKVRAKQKVAEQEASSKGKPPRQVADAFLGSRRRNTAALGQVTVTEGGNERRGSGGGGRRSSSATAGSLPSSPKRANNAGRCGREGETPPPNITPPRKSVACTIPTPTPSTTKHPAAATSASTPPPAPPSLPEPPISDNPRPPIDAQDSSSETSCNDKCEQPSPVSVLDAAVTWPSHGRTFWTPPSPSNNADFHVRDISCPAAKRHYVLYVRDILVAAGFTAHGIVVVRCFSAQYGLDPGLFRRLEYQYYCRKRFLPPTSDNITLHALDRRLLYDTVDHMVLYKLGMPAEPVDPWLHAGKPCVYYMRSGKHLLEQIWADISFDSAQDHFDSADDLDQTLEDLVARDLSRSSWVSTCRELESVGLSIEALIFDSLVDEAIHDFTTP